MYIIYFQNIFTIFKFYYVQICLCIYGVTSTPYCALTKAAVDNVGHPKRCNHLLIFKLFTRLKKGRARLLLEIRALRFLDFSARKMNDDLRTWAPKGVFMFACVSGDHGLVSCDRSGTLSATRRMAAVSPLCRELRRLKRHSPENVPRRGNILWWTKGRAPRRMAQGSL